MRNLNFIFILAIILLISCDPCQEVDCPYPFTEEELVWLPYNANDELIFIESISQDSLIYMILLKESEKLEPTDPFSPYCQTSCYYQLRITGDRRFANHNLERFGFAIDKTISSFRITKQAGINSEFEFNLINSVKMDSLFINGKYIKDVYKYICKPEQDRVAETYVKKGMGLVKIVFRNGQEFELVEHRKAK